MEKKNIPKTLCYIGFIFMIIISIQLRNLPAGIFSMFMLMWFHFDNIKEAQDKRLEELLKR